MDTCDDDAAATSSKTGLLSLPDELLMHIVDRLAGPIRCTLNSCERDGISSGDLPRLRLANRRFSRIVQEQLYRTPNASTQCEKPLSGDDLDILLHPEAVRSARMLSLAGTSSFCAGLLASRFRLLRSLKLEFGLPQLTGAQRALVVDHRSLVRLREALQALPLLNLHVQPQEGLVLTEQQLFDLALLGAGHASLRQFCIAVLNDLALAQPIAREDFPTGPTNLSSPLVFLSVKGFSTDQAPIIRRALGYCPRLTEMTLVVRGSDESSAATLNAFTFGIGHRIRRLDLHARNLGRLTWQALAGLPQLESLRLTALALFGEGDWANICFAKLQRINITNNEFSSVPNLLLDLLLRKAVNRQLLPSLRQIGIDSLQGNPLPDAQRTERVHAMLAAHDQLLEARKGIRVNPPTFKEETVRKLRALEARTETEPDA